MNMKPRSLESPPAAPPKHKLAFITWLGIFPLITGLLIALEPLMQSWPVVARTFVLTAVLVPLMVYVVVPLLSRAFAPWLYGRPRA